MSKVFDKDEIMKVISEFIYFSSPKDLFHLCRDEEYLKNEKNEKLRRYPITDMQADGTYNVPARNLVR